MKIFTELICTAQEFIRAAEGGERSAASLRDVARCVKVYRWFCTYFASMASQGESVMSLEDILQCQPNCRSQMRSSLVLCLAYSYHARLGRDARCDLRITLADKWRELQTLRSTFWQQQQQNGRQGIRTMGGGGRHQQYQPRCAWLELTADLFLREVALR